MPRGTGFVALVLAAVVGVALEARAEVTRPHGPRFPANSGVKARDVMELQKTEKVKFLSPKSLSVGTYRVSDGDTVVIGRPRFGTFKLITLKDGEVHPILFPNNKADPKKSTISIRMVEMDTPEMHVRDKNGKWVGQGKSGKWAGQILSLIITKATKLEIEPNRNQPIDKYGRVLGTLYATVRRGAGEQRVNINREMVRIGAADLYSIYTPDFDLDYFNELRGLAKTAEHNKWGIYGKKHHMARRPYIFRSEKTGRPIEKYVVNMNTGIIYNHKAARRIHVHDRLWVDPLDLDAAIKQLHLKKAKNLRIVEIAPEDR